MANVHYTRKLPDFSPVQPGSRAVISIPRGPTYRTLVLKYAESGTKANAAKMKASLTNIRLKINGSVRWEASGARVIDVLTNYYGHTFEDGLLFIDLARHEADSRLTSDGTMWGTRNVQTFHLEVDIAKTATSPTLTAFAVVDPEERDLGAIVEVHEQQFSTSVGGVFEIPDLPQSRGLLKALHCFSKNIEGLEISINQLDFQNADIDVLKALYKRKPSGRVPQNGYEHYDPVYLDRLTDVLPMQAEDWRLKLEMSRAGSVGIFMETVNTPLGPEKR